MARTTAALVGGICECDSDSTKASYVALAPFISIANELVTECCTSGSHTELRLELIERWLSAHFYHHRDMKAQMEKAGSVSQNLQSKVDLGFDNTHYGQAAMRLDTEGGLAALNERIKKGKRATVSVTWLGTADPTDIS